MFVIQQHASWSPRDGFHMEYLLWNELPPRPIDGAAQRKQNGIDEQQEEKRKKKKIFRSIESQHTI